MSTENTTNVVTNIRNLVADIDRRATATARLGAEQQTMIETFNGALDSKPCARFAEISAGLAWAKVAAPGQHDRLIAAFEVAQKQEYDLYCRIRDLQAETLTAVERHVEQSVSEEFRDGIVAHRSKTYQAESQAQLAVQRTELTSNVRESAEILRQHALNLADNIVAMEAELVRCISVAKKYGVKVAKAA